MPAIPRRVGKMLGRLTSLENRMSTWENSWKSTLSLSSGMPLPVSTQENRMPSAPLAAVPDCSSTTRATPPALVNLTALSITTYRMRPVRSYPTFSSLLPTRKSRMKAGLWIGVQNVEDDAASPADSALITLTTSKQAIPASTGPYPES